MKTVRIACLLLMLVVTMTACGGPDGESPTTPDCDDPSLSTSDRQKYCLQGQPDATTPPALQTERVGTPFSYEETFNDNTAPVQWQVTVTSLTCGVSKLPGAASNPEWDGSDAIPKYVDATPPAGKTYCELVASLKNVGTTPASSPIDFDDIVTSAGQFTQTGDDDLVDDNLNTLHGTSPINPGDTTKYYEVWSVAQGAKPKAVLFPRTTINGGPTIQVLSA